MYCIYHYKNKMALEAFNYDEQKTEKKLPSQQEKKDTKEKVSSKEAPVDQQKFIKDKYTRLDDVLRKKEKSKLKFDNNDFMWWWTLDTKRGKVDFNINRGKWSWDDVELVIKDNKDVFKILLENKEWDGKYYMTVLKNWIAQKQPSANSIATKYIGML